MNFYSNKTKRLISRIIIAILIIAMVVPLVIAGVSMAN